MNRVFSKFVCMTVLATSVMASSAMPAFAADYSEPGFIADHNSTWGDLYRYFDLEGFAAMSTELQAQYDSTLLESEDTFVSLQTVSSDDDVDSVFATGHLYPINEDAVDAGDGQYSRSSDIGALLNLTLGVSSTSDTIDYTAGLFATVKCPYMAISMSLYDTVDKKYIAWDSGYTTNAKVCSLDDSFTDLNSNRKYTVKAVSAVTPPAGYYGNGTLTVQKTKSTK